MRDHSHQLDHQVDADGNHVVTQVASQGQPIEGAAKRTHQAIMR